MKRKSNSLPSWTYLSELTSSASTEAHRIRQQIQRVQRVLEEIPPETSEILYKYLGDSFLSIPQRLDDLEESLNGSKYALSLIQRELLKTTIPSSLKNEIEAVVKNVPPQSNKEAYRTPDISGVKTFVTERRDKGLDSTSTRSTEHNHQDRPSTPERKDQALPLPNEHRKNRVREMKPAPGAYNVPTKEAKTHHKKKKVQPFTEQSTPVRTTGVPGDLKGHPINDKCTTMAGPRRTMEAKAMNPIYFVTDAGRIATYDGDFSEENGFTLKLSTSDGEVHFASLDDLVDQTFFRRADDLDRFFEGIDTRLSSTEEEFEEEEGKTARQKKQRGKDKLESQKYYRKNKMKAKRRQRMRYKRMKKNPKFKRKMKLRRMRMKRNPNAFRRRASEELIERVASTYAEKKAAAPSYTWNQVRKDKRLRDRLMLPNNIRTEDQYYDWLAEQSAGSSSYRSMGVPRNRPDGSDLLRPHSQAPGRRRRMPDLDDVPF